MNKMEVVNNFENKLLERREVKVVIESDGPTVSRDKVKAELAKKFKAKEDMIIIDSINSNFGSLDVEVNANIYSKKDVLERLTPKHILNRNTKAPVKEEEAPAPAAPAEEKPAEEPAASEEVAPVEEATEEKSEEAPTESGDEAEEPAKEEEVKEE